MRARAGSVYHFRNGEALGGRRSGLWLQLSEDGRRQASTDKFEEDERDAGEQRDRQRFPNERKRHQEGAVEIPEERRKTKKKGVIFEERRGRMMS